MHVFQKPALTEGESVVLPCMQLLGPEQNGIEVGPDLKSEVFPKKSQSSPIEAGLPPCPVPLKSFDVSWGYHGAPVIRVTIELTCHPSNICSGAFLPGMA